MIDLRPAEERPPQNQRETSWPPCRRPNQVVRGEWLLVDVNARESMVIVFQQRHFAVPG